MNEKLSNINHFNLLRIYMFEKKEVRYFFLHVLISPTLELN